MKTKSLSIAGLLILGFASLSMSVSMSTLPTSAKTASAAKTPQSALRGEVYFLERIALPPNAHLHLSLVGRALGAKYLPVSSVVIPARNGITPFIIPLPPSQLRPALPLRLQAWIVASGRVVMIGHAPKTIVSSFDKPVRMRMKIASARGDEGSMSGGEMSEPDISDGASGSINLPSLYLLNGTVTKRDRRALLPDARVVVTLSDVSRADAPAVVLGRRTIHLKGQQLPVKWEFGVSLNKIRPNGRYALRAQVYEGGKLTYTTDTFVGVTSENADEARELLVKSAR